MRSAALTLILLTLTAAGAWAGPNAGGAIFLHDVGVEYTTDTTDYCGMGTPPVSCADADVEIDSETPVVFTLYAAFPAGSSPRLKGIVFGVEYPASVIVVAWGPCPEGSFEIASGAWPESGSGDSIVFPITKTTELAEVGWFAGYWYSTYGADVLQLTPSPDGFAQFGDDAVPAVLDDIAALGSMGFGMAGETACPPTGTGACCYDNQCEVLTLAECDALNGTWFEGLTCDPNPCPSPVLEKTWGSIKSRYR